MTYVRCDKYTFSWIERHLRVQRACKDGHHTDNYLLTCPTRLSNTWYVMRYTRTWKYNSIFYAGYNYDEMHFSVVNIVFSLAIKISSLVRHVHEVRTGQSIVRMLWTFAVCWIICILTCVWPQCYSDLAWLIGDLVNGSQCVNPVKHYWRYPLCKSQKCIYV